MEILQLNIKTTKMRQGLTSRFELVAKISDFSYRSMKNKTEKKKKEAKRIKLQRNVRHH